MSYTEQINKIEDTYGLRHGTLRKFYNEWVCDYPADASTLDALILRDLDREALYFGDTSTIPTYLYYAPKDIAIEPETGDLLDPDDLEEDW